MNEPAIPPIGFLREGSFVVWYRSCMDVLDRAARGVLFLILFGELCLILTEVFQRLAADHSFLWAEEISRLALLGLAFIGGALAYRAQHNAIISVVTGRLSPYTKSTVSALVDICILLIACMVFYTAFDLYEINSESLMPMLQWSLGLTVIPLMIGMVLLLLFVLERTMQLHSAGAILRAGTIAAVFIVITLAMRYFPELRPGPAAALVLMLMVFFASILIGLPVAFAMLLGSLLFLTATDLAPIVAVTQNTIDGAGHFILLALPFFIWAGLIMERGGISLRLVNFAMAFIGHFRGGLSQVVVMTTFLVSGVSGSKIADVVAVGSVMRDELKKNGYSLPEGAAVLAASTAMSETIPPSIAMLVLGSVVPVSIGAMFIAGLLPAGILATILMVLVYIKALRNPTPRIARAGADHIIKETISVIIPMLMPVILVGGIKFGIATPTEVSSIGVLYGIIVSVGAYRSIGLKAFVRIAMECGVMSGMVLLMIAAAGSFAWIMAAGNLPEFLVSLLHAAGNNRYAFLAGSVVILIIVGSLLEGLPALIILGPILFPIATGLGIDGVHYAMVILLSMGVGIFIPPLGIGFYVACSVMNANVEATSKALLPYLLALLGGIAIVAAVPWFSLALVHFFGH